MAANVETRLTAPINQEANSRPAVNTAAVASFAAAAGKRHYVVMAIISASGTAPAAGNYQATLAYTRGGAVKTLGISLPAAAFAPVIVNFGSHPIEGDTETAITLTTPALGAGAQSEAQLVGYTRAE